MIAKSRLFALVCGVLFSQLCIAQAPAGAPAGATGLCNDGTYYTGATKKGACRGHKGLKDWYASASPASEKTQASTTPVTPTSAAVPTGATGICNDGTYYTGATKKGACRGHKGVKDWYGSASAASDKGRTSTTAVTPSSSAAPTSAPNPAPAKTPSSEATPAPGGGAGQVWVNTSTNVYHCEGSKWYGKTKAGGYMTEAEAKAKGARPDHNKPCK